MILKYPLLLTLFRKLVIVVKKQVLFALCAVFMIFTLVACDKDSDSSNISQTDTVGISDSQTEEAELMDFAGKISVAFQREDIKAFNELIESNSLTWVSLYGGAAYVETSAVKDKSEFFFDSGSLMQNSTEAVPPKVDLELKSKMFGDSAAEFRVADEKQGFLESLDWSKADCDYMQAHFHAYYDELAWTVDRPVDENGWVIYKLSNDTYIYTNGIGWYDDTFSARVFAGQLFVIKRNGDKLGIVAFINAK